MHDNPLAPSYRKIRYVPPLGSRRDVTVSWSRTGRWRYFTPTVGLAVVRSLECWAPSYSSLRILPKERRAVMLSPKLTTPTMVIAVDTEVMPVIQPTNRLVGNTNPWL